MKKRKPELTEILLQCPIFSIKKEVHRVDRLQRTHDYFVIEPTNWVNIIAITPQKEVILIEQYRYGIGKITTEIPGGMVDSGEEPLAAAQRELMEETGFSAPHWHLLGVNEPNPAIQNNYCYTFLAQDAVCVQQQKLDNTEEIFVRYVPLVEISQLIIKGEIQHAIVIAAFHFYHLFENGKSQQ